MDLTALRNQTVAWESMTGTDLHDDATYADAVDVPARKLQHLRQITGRDNEVITATNIFMMAPEWTGKIRDLLDGREVIAVISQTTTQGEVVGFQALTK